MNLRKLAVTDHPTHQLISQRWSPYAFADKSLSHEDLCSLFEAARWAASSYNEQPWSYIVASKSDPAAHQQLVTCLVEGNQAWAAAAPVLAIGCTSLQFTHNGKPNSAAMHDLGLASANLTVEATSRGLSVHQMIGILPDKVREVYGVPDTVLPLTALAIGYAADPTTLPEKLRERDLSERQRKPISEFVFGAKWGTQYAR